jgi:SAM-dependent methyltransferase
MSQAKMSADEMANYYLRVHQDVLARDVQDDLSAVIAPSGNRFVNHFTDFAHRLGMQRAFTFLENQWSSLINRSVLDLGCGRGRWSKEYAKRGATVTGIDISPQAIGILTDEMPQHRFISGDIATVSFPDESFDIVNSVTVLQHMPDWKQRIALDHLSRWLKPGGFAVLLENVTAFDAPHVFAHRADDWIRIVEATGLKCRSSCGSNFEVLFEVKSWLMRWLRGNQLPDKSAVPTMMPAEAFSLKHHIEDGIRTVLAVISFPVEWTCHMFPLSTPTHRVMIFSKQGFYFRRTDRSVSHINGEVVQQ